MDVKWRLFCRRGQAGLKLAQTAFDASLGRLILNPSANFPNILFHLVHILHPPAFLSYCSKHMCTQHIFQNVSTP